MSGTKTEDKHFIVQVVIWTNDKDFRSRFISDSAGVSLLEHMDGQTIHFGEIYDEYTEVEGVFLKSNMLVEEITVEEAETLIKHIGQSLSTYYLPDYFDGPPED